MINSSSYSNSQSDSNQDPYERLKTESSEQMQTCPVKEIPNQRDSSGISFAGAMNKLFQVFQSKENSHKTETKK